MDVTTIKHSLANEMMMTHHMRYIFTPVNETIENILSPATIC